MSATTRQLIYIASLAKAAQVPVPRVNTLGEASHAIEKLLRQCPIRDGTARAVDQLLSTARITREDLASAVGVSGFSSSDGCSEHDGQRALNILQSRKQSRLATLPSGTSEAGQLRAAPFRVQPPRRLKGNPFAEPQLMPDKAPPRMSRPDDYDWITSVTHGVTRTTAYAALKVLRDGGLFILRVGLPDDGWSLSSEEMHILGLMKPSPFFVGSVRDPMANSNFWSRNWAYEQARLGESTTPPERIVEVKNQDGTVARMLVRNCERRDPGHTR